MMALNRRRWFRMLAAIFAGGSVSAAFLATRPTTTLVAAAESDATIVVTDGIGNQSGPVLLVDREPFDFELHWQVAHEHLQKIFPSIVAEAERDLKFLEGTRWP